MGPSGPAAPWHGHGNCKRGRVTGDEDNGRAKHWTVDIYLSEKSGPRRLRGRRVRPHACRGTAAYPRRQTAVRGWGHARKNPSDRDVPEIGDELAAARALSDLAHHLLEAAARDIEAMTGEQAAVHD
ncbi:DUF1876 domain-containing protein [Yinghuangia aomiensis]